MEVHFSGASRPGSHSFQEEGETLPSSSGKAPLTRGHRWDNLPEHFCAPRSSIAEDPSFAFGHPLLLLVVVCRDHPEG